MSEMEKRIKKKFKAVQNEHKTGNKKTITEEKYLIQPQKQK